jgi:hypothetical protein
MNSEANNEGLEVVATLTVSFDEGDGGSAIEQVETHTLLDEGAHDLCRHSEALAGYAVRDARIAELEEQRDRFMASIDRKHKLMNEDAAEQYGRGDVMDKDGNFSLGAQIIVIVPLLVIGLMMATFL